MVRTWATSRSSRVRRRERSFDLPHADSRSRSRSCCASLRALRGAGGGEECWERDGVLREWDGADGRVSLEDDDGSWVSIFGKGKSVLARWWSWW